MSQIIVVKVGGHATHQLTEEFFEQLRICVTWANKF